jgi:integrase
LWRLVLLRGLRRGEVCGLKWDDIDLDSGHLRIRRALLEFAARHRPKVVSAQLGHSTTQITADIYQHVRRVKADDAAELVAALLAPGRPA